MNLSGTFKNRVDGNFPAVLIIELDFNSSYWQIYMASKILLGCIFQLMLFMNELCSMY